MLKTSTLLVLSLFSLCTLATVTSDVQVLNVDGRERSFILRTPSQHIERMPLVIVLHGGGGNGEHAERVTGFTQKAQQENFIVAYPNGTGNKKRFTWNAEHCCGQAMHQNSQDVEFIRALIDHLIQHYSVDPNRVYVTGMSNGGMMTHRLGIELSDKIAAIAPVVATLFGDETLPKEPISALIINGQKDTSVPFEGGQPNPRFKHSWGKLPTQPAKEQALFWSKANHCKHSNTRETDTLSHTTYHCPKQVSVEFYALKNDGHAWPGGRKGRLRADKPNPNFNATDLIWGFFRAHHRAE